MTFIRYSTSQFWRHGVQRMNRNPNHNRAFHSQLCRSTSCSVSNLSSNNKSNNNNNNNIPNLYSKNHERYFSSAAPSNNDNNDEDDEEEEEDPDLKKRNKSIIVNENGQSVYMLPNQRVYKVNPQTGVKRNVHQVSLGSFWMVKVSSVCWCWCWFRYLSSSFRCISLHYVSFHSIPSHSLYTRDIFECHLMYATM